MEIEYCAIVDMQGFCGNDKIFVPKEVYVLNCKYLNMENEYHAILKPPFEFDKLEVKYKKTATWLSKNYHNLYWNK
jgi:hypothetical protein